MMSQLTDPLSDLSWAGPTVQRRLRVEPFAVLREHGLDLPAETPRSIVAEVARVLLLVWSDGQVLPREQFHIDPGDEGLLFGRGVWESTRTVNGEPWLWPLHVDRLLRTAELLGIRADPGRIPDAGEVMRFVRSLTTMDVLVRLNVSAGPPGRPGRVWMTASLPPIPLSAIRLQTAQYPFEKGQPYLTWKTFQYASRLQIGREAGRSGYHSVLFVDEAGCVLEAAHANIFFRLADGWVTPLADGGLLPGTTRRHLLDHSPRAIRERTIRVGEIATASEAFVTNSNVGIVPVAAIDDRSFECGPETIELSRWLTSL